LWESRKGERLYVRPPDLKSLRDDHKILIADFEARLHRSNVAPEESGLR
jgi:hypothetical protein